MSQSGFTRLVAGSRSVSLYSICLARGWYQPHTGCFQPLSGLLGWLLSARADLWPPTFPSINSFPLTIKQWKVFFRAGRKGVVFTMGCVHKHHASFLRLSVRDRNRFIMCTCFCQTENAWYFPSNMYLRPFKYIFSLKMKDLFVYAHNSPLCRWAVLPLFFFNTLASCWAVWRSAYFQPRGHYCLHRVPHFDFPLSPQNLQIFSPHSFHCHRQLWLLYTAMHGSDRRCWSSCFQTAQNYVGISMWWWFSSHFMNRATQPN